MTKIDLYNEAESQHKSEFITKNEAGTGYRMKLFSIRDKSETSFQGTFELEDGRLYSQRFFADTTDKETLQSIMQRWITCDIEITSKGFQRIFNVELEDEDAPDPADEPRKMTTEEYLNSIPTTYNDDVPF